MARIPEEVIERLKREVLLERLVTGFGVELQRHGANLLGRCPFHEDRTPSLSVTPSTNRWHCLGKCNVGGTVIDWVMKTRGVSFRHAVELLRADHPSLAAGDGRVVRKGTTVKLAAPVAPDAGDQETLRGVVEFYHGTLKESPEALRYLESRGLVHPEMIERFKLGFANRKLGLTLPDKNRKAGAELRGRLERLGVLRATSGHEHLNGSLVFPVFNLAGDVLGMYGRKITPGLRAGTPVHLYLPGPHRGVWNEEALQASKEIILCESIIDALTFWCAGFRNVTASYGVNGFTEDHRAAFQRHGVEQVWIAYDRDDAGETAAERLKEELHKLGIGTHRVLFPKGMDANEYGLKVTPASQSLAVLLNGAAWWDKSTPAAKEQIDDQEPPPVIPAAVDREVKINGDEITIERGDRRYRVRGLQKNTSTEVLKVNLLVTRQEEFHVDTLDLLTDRQRAAYIKRAAEELAINEDVIRKDVGQVLLALEKLQAAEIRKALETKNPEVEINEEDRAAALSLLRDPKLLDRILEDFERCGIVGEETNKLVGYLAAVSRHLESPLAILVQSSSAAGKSSLMDAVLDFVPEEERTHYSAMTGQALFYMGEMDLKHKVLSIVEEEGASRAAYALKLLQSEGALSIASTGKDPTTGRLVTHQYRVEGPVMIFLTTTAIDLDEELLNRCLVLTVNEEREQTQAIHRLQREQQTLEGLLRRQARPAILARHQNAQRLLKPLLVANPYAGELTFPDHRTRMRRDHTKYLTLIRAIAFLHQHQRQVKTERGVSYIEATREDVATADRLIKDLLARSLDELPPQTRRLLLFLDAMVTEKSQQLKMERKDFHFSRREVCAYTNWGMTQVRVHLERLQQMEYVIAHQGGRGLTFEYELACDPEQIHGYDSNLAGSKRPQNGGLAGGSRGEETRIKPASDSVFDGNRKKRTLTEA
jgi:DNA primase catalytic core